MTLRILHILDHSVPLQSGYAFRTLAILKQQRALGWETFHLTGPKQGPVALIEEQVDGWHFYRTPPPHRLFQAVPGLREIEVMANITERIEQIAKRVRPHILHAHSPVLNAIPALRVGRRLGIPVVYEVRASWEDAAVDHGTARAGGLRYRLSRGLETWALRRANAITTICEGLRGDILARGIPAEKVTVIPNAVDIEKFSADGWPDPHLKQQLGLNGALVLGFIGSFYAYEGLAVLLCALPRMLLQNASIRILLVGGGRQEAGLKQLASELGITSQVIFAGRVPHGDVPRYYDLIDILIYPRLSMRLTELVTPLKPLEAMAQGRLLAASDVGGHRELIRPGVTGTLFKAGDPEALAVAVLDLARHPERWAALKSNARSFVESEGNWRGSVARYGGVYDALLRKVALKNAKGLTIGLVGPLPPASGGMANQTRQLARLLKQEGVKVDILQVNAPYRPHWVAPLRGIRALFRLAPFLVRLWIAAGQVHLFHVMANSGWAWHLCAAPAVWIAKLRGVPVVVNYRGGGAEQFLARSIFSVRPTMRMADRVVVPSGFLQQVFERFGLTAQVVPNIVDVSRFVPRAASHSRSNGPHLIVTRNLEAIYDIGTALRSLAIVRETWLGARMTIAGSGPEQDRLVALARELGLAAHVRFTGRLDNDRIDQLYQQADLFLNPSLIDNMPISILEALATGVPVVSTDVGGIPFLVEHQKTALLVPPRDPAKMALALLELLNDPPKAERLANAGREAAQQYAWHNVRGRLFDVYSALAPIAPGSPAVEAK